MGKPTEEQRPVIENASANNMVIAAPGSGKSLRDPLIISPKRNHV
ncbi:resolvase [Salmonella enterica subsp. enterica serovar Agona]